MIPISWGIAFLEYCFAVPANRIGHQVYSAAQLKTMQEVITLIVFAIFSVTYLGEPLKWNHGVAFGLINQPAYFAFTSLIGRDQAKGRRIPFERLHRRSYQGDGLEYLAKYLMAVARQKYVPEPDLGITRSILAHNLCKS